MKLHKKQYKILVVEDNVSLRSGIVTTLEKDGYTVDSASDGDEGLRKTRSSSWNLVITDIKMPKVDGITLFKTVKSHFPAIDVIVITAFATVDIAVDTIKNGAEDFITKPFPLAELRAKVTTLYDRWENRQKITESHSDSHQIIGNSDAIKKIRRLIQKVAESDSPVLI
ncbi:MAG: sigma-54-dependent Fis family transcriptional regulator, partial [Candidatus Marinimicrobia bacterium]|nr:sigma-54-dependent Fis family transcriptional regulator [Candidatus Neomarinimicrobiota bacterium]